jgi:hypothetical protein
VNDYGIIIQGRGGCSCGKPAGRVAWVSGLYCCDSHINLNHLGLFAHY